MKESYGEGDEETEERRKISVAEILFDAGAVKFNFGEGYTFVSGLRSPLYVDSRLLFYEPSRRRKIIRILDSYVKNNGIEAEIIAGTAIGGVAPAVLLADRSGSEFVYVRKDAKEHGRKKCVEGGDVSGKHVLLVEDLVTTGLSSMVAAEKLKGAGALIRDCVAITSYGFAEVPQKFQHAHIRLHALTNACAVVKVAENRGLVSHGEHQKVQQWLDSFT